MLDAYGKWWVVLLVVLASLLLANELGYRIGRRQEGATSDQKAMAGVMVGAILALLGLLLAFSFSIVETRFGTRKALVLQEANAIGTAYLRAKTIPDPQGDDVQELLAEYVRLRLRPDDPIALQEALRRSPELHDKMWAEMVDVAKEHPTSELVGRFQEALNAVIDLHQSRVTVSLYQRLPRPILLTLYFVSLLGLMVLGYGLGLARSRSMLASVVLILAVSSVVVVIVELDRPGARIFRVNQQAMADVQTMIEKDEARNGGAISQAPP